MKIRLLTAAVFFLFLSFAPNIKAEVLDKIIVIVNDEIITQGEVERIIIPIYGQYRQLYGGEELNKKLNEAWSGVLEKLIEDKLLLTEAKRRKIEVKDHEIDGKIEEIKKHFPSEDEFKRAMASESMGYGELRAKYKERIMIEKLIDSEVRRRVSVAPGEIIEYYRENEKEFLRPKEVRLKSILIKAAEERPREAALELARRIKVRLEEGGDFSLIAERYSGGPYASEGGDMGWVKEGELMQKINETVFELDEGETSDILSTKMGFHIFRVGEKKPEQKITFREARDRIEEIIYNKKIEARVGEWIEELKEDAYIAFR